MTERLWTIEETAQYLCVPVETLYAWRRRRNLQGKTYGPSAAKIGKHLRYKPETVRAWVDTQTAVAA